MKLYNAKKLIALLLAVYISLSMTPLSSLANFNDENDDIASSIDILPIDEITNQDNSTSPEDVMATNEAPEGYEPSNTILDPAQNLHTFAEYSETDGKKFLLIEDNLPWDSTVNQRILSTITEYKKVTSSQFLQEDLSEYAVIVFANDQQFSAYENYREFKEYMELFASLGGVIVFGACDAGWAAGSLIESLPGDVTKQTHYVHSNYIVDYNHPIVSGSLSGREALVDEDLFSNYCSHVSFDEASLPPGSIIILRESKTNRPTFVEYPLGQGRVIASGLTWEHNYDRGGEWFDSDGESGYRGYFAQKAMADMFRYAIRVSNIDVTELGSLRTYQQKINAHTIVVVDKNTLDPIANAYVTINGKSYQSDENGIVSYDEKYGIGTVRVAMTNYRINVQCYDIQARANRMVFMEKDINDGRPYLSLVSDTFKLIDLRNQVRNFTQDDNTMINIWVSGEWGSHPSGKYILYQEGVQGGETGKSIEARLIGEGALIPELALFSFAPGLVLNPEQPVKLKMIAENGTESVPITINLTIGKKNAVSNQFNNSYNVNNVTQMEIGGQATTNTSGQDFAKLFPLDFSFKGALVPLELSSSESADGYTIKGVIGIKGGKYTNGLLNDDTNEWKSFKDNILKAKGLYSDREKLLNAMKDKLSPTKFKTSFDFDVKVCGFIEVKLDKNGNIVQSSGGIIVKGDGSFKFGQTFLAGPIPVYYELKLGAGVNFTGEIEFFSADDGLKFELGGSIKIIVPKVALGGGVGVRGVATVGIEGGADLNIDIVPNWKGTLEAYGAVNIKVLFVVDFQWKFAKGSWQLWPQTRALAPMNMFGNEIEGMIPELSLSARDYAQKTTPWNGVVTTFVNAQSMLRSLSIDTDSITSLQDWILPDTIPQIVKVGDYLVLLFQHDDPTRELGNNTVLMYSIYKNDSWNEPLPVWQSDTADMFFDQIVVNDDLYVVWQKQRAIVTKDTVDELLKEVSENSEICYAKFNKITGVFENQVFVSNNNVLDMYPTIAVNGTEVSVIWVSNNTSDALGMTGTYSIMKSVLSSDSFGTPVKLYETNEFIAELAAGYANGKLEVAFTSGDSVENTFTYALDDSIATKYSGFDTAIALQYKNEGFYWNSLGSVYRLNTITKNVTRIGVPDTTAITSSYKLVDTDDKTAIVWISDEIEYYDIKASICIEDDVWTNPITLFTTDDDRIIQYMSITVADSGIWNIIMNMASRSIDMSSLVFATVTPKTETELVYAFGDMGDAINGIQPISFAITNLGETTVDTLEIRIASANIEFYVNSMTCNIEPGATTEFIVDIDVSALNSVTDITVFAMAKDEKDISNNSIIFQLGKVDVSLELSQYQIGDILVVAAQIKNASKIPANVSISIIEDSLDGIVLDMKNIGIIDNTQDYVYMYQIDIQKIAFGDLNSKVYFFKIDTLESNYNEFNNYDLIIVYRDTVQEISSEPIQEITIVNTTGVSVVQSSIYLRLSDEYFDTAQLSAIVTPANATNKGVYWYVENQDVALVDSFGIITPLSVGETEVTAITYDGEFTDVVTVIVTADEGKVFTIIAMADTGGIVYGGGTYYAGTSVTLTASAKSGYRFEGWYEGGEKIKDAGVVYTFTATADRQLEARFTKASFLLGDVNSDDELDIGDVNLLYMYVRSKAELTDDALLAADVNDDGEIDIGDVNMLYMFIRGKIASLG